MGSRLVRAAQNPQMALRMAIRQVLMSLGISFILPIISLAIPLIQAGMKAYIDAEIKRKLEGERKTLYSEIRKNMTAEDRQLLNELLAS